jgi:hypothetical protein
MGVGASSVRARRPLTANTAPSTGAVRVIGGRRMTIAPAEVQVPVHVIRVRRVVRRVRVPSCTCPWLCP